MSTRAVVTIQDSCDTFHIYTHCDGYPEYQVKRIADAIPFAWPFPRFEAMDFAAAFVRGSKEHGGNIYLTADWNRHSDLEYRYEISANRPALQITVFTVSGDTSEKVWSGTLPEMQQKYSK